MLPPKAALPRSNDAPDLMLRARRIIPSTGQTPIDHGYVMIRDGRIVDVGSGVESPPDGFEVVDAGDATLLPGLIDCHTHVAGLRREHAEGIDEAERIAADTIDLVSGLSDVLRSGVTSLRDCGYPDHAVFAVREAARSGRIDAPRMQLSGRAICATGGHGASISVEVDGVDQIRRAVRIEAKAGAEWLKLMVTGGTATPGEAVTDVQLTFEEVAAAVDEAHRRGRKVSAHCSNREGARIAIEAGVDSIEHGISLDEVLVELMADRDIWLGTTLRCTQVEGTAGPGSGIPAFVRQKAAAVYEQQMASFRRAMAAGVPIAAATDAAQPYLPLGGNTLASELEVFVELGMSPEGALHAATRDAARLLSMESTLGTVEPGKWADLIAVDGDPLVDIGSLRNVRLVVADGRVIRRQ